MNDKMRAEFEAAITKDRMDAGYDEPNLRMHEWEGSQCYNETHVQAAWWGWQASRAALAVELPPAPVPQKRYGGTYTRTESAYHQGQMSVTRAIEAAGVRVKL